MTERDADVDLRLSGKIVSRCCVEYVFILEFLEKHARTVIRIGGRIYIEYSDTRLSLSGEKSTEAAQACFLFGKTVQKALGRQDGSLDLSLGWALG